MIAPRTLSCNFDAVVAALFTHELQLIICNHYLYAIAYLRCIYSCADIL